MSFVGPERERADPRRAVEDARVGHGSLVLVTGEAGVGKTRLLEEIDAEADARGLRVLVGHSTRDEGRSPYPPFTEMIEQGMVTPRSPATLRRALGEAAPEIARIAPALRLVVPEFPAPLDLPPEQARRPRLGGRRAPPRHRPGHRRGPRQPHGAGRPRLLAVPHAARPRRPGDREAAAALAAEVATRYRDLGLQGRADALHDG